MWRSRSILSAVLFLTSICSGCGVDAPIIEPGEPGQKAGSILGKETQEIGEFDPDAGRNVSDSKIRATNPLTGPLEALGPMMEKVSKLGTDHAVALYHAEHGEYPKTHEEFMQKIIKANNMRLPVLPAGAEYQYDVANHKLVVVKAQK